MSNEFETWDATEQAERVRRGDVAPIELVDAAIARIEERNPRLNAVVHFAFERARERARAAANAEDAPFRGVPTLLKELGGHEAGSPCHMGMRALKDANWVEPTTSHFTAKVLAAGLLVLGRTNSPEVGLMPITEPAAYGPSRNPHDPTRTPGGSSGGSAAAVASGMVAAAHASDGGGSIRGPASACGLVGLKPTRGRSSMGPNAGERWSGLSVEGFLTHTVRDTAALLDVVAGPMPGDPYSAAPPAETFASAATQEPGRLRIGFLAATPRHGLSTHPDCQAAVHNTAQLLERLGHRVEESFPADLGEAEIMRTYVGIVSANTARVLEVVGDKVGRVLGADDVEPLTWALAEIGRGISVTQYLAAIEAIHAAGRRTAAWHAQGYDLLLTPTYADLPAKVGDLVCSAENPLGDFMKSAPYGAFTAIFNLTGQPAISLPLHRTAAGLPVGVQLVAPYGREDLLLSTAAQLERAAPWWPAAKPA